MYLDNAATAQRPTPVLERVRQFYQTDNANVHRGVHTLAQRATTAYETARQKVQHFLHAAAPEEIIFTRGCTEALNLVAAPYGRTHLQAGDEIVISVAEHHSNLIPWQQLAHQTGARLRYIGLTATGELDLAAAQQLINDHTKLVAVAHATNVLGTINPIQQLAALAHAHGAVIVVDGAQAVPHMPVDVQALDADFYAFSGHKLMAPTGIGVLYGKAALLADMPPYQYGGDMIEHVSFEETTFAMPPARFEAGTPAIAQAVGLAASLQYLMQFDFSAIEAYEAELTRYMSREMLNVNGLKIVGNIPDKGGVCSFSIQGIHPQDLAFVLGKEGVAVRTGHFCAEPLVNLLGYTSLARASLGIYSIKEDVDDFIKALYKAKSFFE